jgi:hypothetical protein
LTCCRGQRRCELIARARSTDKGALALGDYARNNDPFSKVGKTQVSVEIASVIRASDDSFRVEWVGRRYVDDALAPTERWSAILTIVVQMPTDAERNCAGRAVSCFRRFELREWGGVVCRRRLLGHLKSRRKACGCLALREDAYLAWIIPGNQLQHRSER